MANPHTPSSAGTAPHRHEPSPSPDSSPRNRRPLRRDAAENRERILYAAKQIFADRGLEAPVDEIARVAGVGMGTFYRHFPTKQALIDELVGDVRRRLLEIGLRARQLGDDI